MTLTDPTAQQLYRTLLDPQTEDKDTAALVFADRLEECGDGARAEFIRLQCHLSSSESWVDGPASRAREFALLVAARDEWLMVACHECEGKGKIRQETFDPASGEYRSSGVKSCKTCNGTGDASRLTKKTEGWTSGIGNYNNYRYSVTFRRGLPDRIEGASLGELFERVFVPRPDDSSKTHEIWRPTPLLLAWVRHHPSVEDVVPNNICPEASAEHGGYYRYYTGDDNNDIPQIVFDALEGEYPTNRHGTAKVPYWNSADKAVAALARAVVTVARDHLTANP